MCFKIHGKYQKLQNWNYANRRICDAREQRRESRAHLELSVLNSYYVRSRAGGLNPATNL